MTHLSEGALRRAVDELAAISDNDRAHLDGCRRCQGTLAKAESDARFLAAVLNENTLDGARAALPDGALSATAPTAPDGAGVDLDANWARLTQRLVTAEVGSQVGAGTSTGSGSGAGTGTGPVPEREFGRPVVVPPALSSRHRSRAVKPLIAVTAAALVVVGATAAAAAGGWLPIFHPKTVAPVSFSVKDLSALSTLPDLRAYGTLAVPKDLQPEMVASAAEVHKRTGLSLPAVKHLPVGVSGSASYAVLPKADAEFTFSAQKAAAEAKRQGTTLPAMPAGLDGSSLRLDLGPVAMEAWTQNEKLPALVVARMNAPTVSSQGASLQSLVGYLLAQPNIPKDLADQVRALVAGGSVLPIAVPSEMATTKATTVNGQPATLITLKDQSAAGLVWIQGGQLNVVAGMLSAADLRAVANGIG
jgi:hypothetical protein